MSVRLLMALGVALTLTACDNAARGVVKINGDLVALTAARAGNPAAGGALTAEDLRLTVQPLPDEGAREAALRFEVASGPGLRVDYRGFYSCAA